MSKEKQEFNPDSLNIFKQRMAFADVDNERKKRYTAIFIMESSLILMGSIYRDLRIEKTLLFIAVNIILFLGILQDKSIGEININKGMLKEIYPFKHLQFFFTRTEKDKVFIHDSKNENIIGLMYYMISGAPINIETNTPAFLRKLYDENIPFTYQFAFKPRISETHIKEEEYKRKMFDQILANLKNKQSVSTPIFSSEEAFDIEILFTFHHTQNINGKIGDVIARVEQRLDEIDYFIEMIFATETTHFRIERLKNSAVIQAIQSRFYSPIDKDIVSNINNIESHSLKQIIKNQFDLPQILLSIYVGFVVYLGYFLIPVDSIKIVTIGCILSYFFIHLYKLFNREKNLYSFTNEKLFFNPFQDISFYTHTQIPGILFVHIPKTSLIMALGYNLINHIPAYFTFKNLNFIRSITSLSKKTDIIYTILCNQYNAKEFIYDNFSFLNEENKNMIAPWIREVDPVTKKEKKKRAIVDNFVRDKWMGIRGGIYKISIINETYAYMYADGFDEKNIVILWNKILENLKINQSFLKMSIERSQCAQIFENQFAIKSFLITSIKTKSIYPHGTHLPVIPVQNKELANFIQVSQEYKKGLDKYLPIELENPTNVVSSIKFAKIFNTQVCRTEYLTGFNNEQLKQGVSISGKMKDIMDIWTLGIASALIKSQNTFIAFDFDSNLKLLYSVQKFKDKILYFHVGKNFNINLFHSECPQQSVESEYIKDIGRSFAITYNLTNIQEDIIQKLMIQADINRNGEVEITKLFPFLSNMEYSRDNKERIDTILKNLQHNFLINAFSINLGQDIAKILFSEYNIIFDLSSLKNEERILAEIVILLKIKYLTDYYSNLELLPSKILMIQEPIEMVMNSNPRHILFISDLINDLKKQNYGILLKCINPSLIYSQLEMMCNTHIGLKTANYKDEECLKKVLNLQESANIISVSERRNNNYLLEILKNLNDYMAIIKRNDIQFPYLIELSLNDLIPLKKVRDEEIQEIMSKEGFNTDSIEQKFMDINIPKLERDFREYSAYIYQEENSKEFGIIKLLKTILEECTLENFSGPLSLSKGKIMDLIKEHVDPLIQRYVNSDKKLKDTRNIILEKLEQHHYLELDADSPFTTGAKNTLKFKPTNIVQSAIEEYLEKKKPYFIIHNSTDNINEESSNDTPSDEITNSNNITIEDTGEITENKREIDTILNNAHEYDDDQNLKHDVPDTSSFKSKSANFNLHDMENSDFYFDSFDGDDN